MLESTLESIVETTEDAGNPCGVCGVRDPEKPMCFRKTKWCCEDHRKILNGETKFV